MVGHCAVTAEISKKMSQLLAVMSLGHVMVGTWLHECECCYDAQIVAETVEGGLGY